MLNDNDGAFGLQDPFSCFLDFFEEGSGCAKWIVFRCFGVDVSKRIARDMIGAPRSR